MANAIKIGSAKTIDQQEFRLGATESKKSGNKI